MIQVVIFFYATCNSCSAKHGAKAMAGYLPGIGRRLLKKKENSLIAGLPVCAIRLNGAEAKWQYRQQKHTG